MPRILFNTPSPFLHGGLATCLPLLQSGLERYVEIETFRHGAVANNETVLWKCVRTALNLASAGIKIFSRRPDVIHVNSAFDNRSIVRDIPLALLAARHGIPLLLMAHGSHPETISDTRRSVEFAKQLLVRNVSLLCVLSTSERDEFENFIPQLKGRVCVVRNVISDLFLNTTRCESDDPLVLFASRFIRKKGPFQLLAAVPSITQHLPTVRFVFLGDGPDAAEFDNEVRARRLGSVVQRLPYAGRDEIAAWYSRAWVLVFPTFFAEGMPMVMAEAMATGTPIVTTRTRFCRSYTAEHENCLYCEPQSPESIAQQVTRLLTDSSMRRRMSESNRSFALQFRQAAVALEFVQLYDRLCRAVPRTSAAVRSEKSAAG